MNKMQHSKTNLQNVPGGCPGNLVRTSVVPSIPAVAFPGICRAPGFGSVSRVSIIKPLIIKIKFNERNHFYLNISSIGVLASRFGTGSLEHSLPSAFCYSFAFWMDLNCKEETITESEDFAATCWGESGEYLRKKESSLKGQQYKEKH